LTHQSLRDRSPLSLTGEGTRRSMRHLTAYRSRKWNARTLRQNETSAESILWSYLRNRRLANFKFRRQFPIGPFVVDFFCLQAGLIVELDGRQHAFSQDSDHNRTFFLQQCGFEIQRFSNSTVFNDREKVCQSILERVQTLSRQGEGGRQTSGDRVRR